MGASACLACPTTDCALGSVAPLPVERSTYTTIPNTVSPFVDEQAAHQNDKWRLIYLLLMIIGPIASAILAFGIVVEVWRPCKRHFYPAPQHRFHCQRLDCLFSEMYAEFLFICMHGITHSLRV